MPIYEYRCESCNAVSEAFVRNGKEPNNCPECGTEDSLKRLISRAGIIFKGSGFYVTDSKGSSSASTSTPSSDSSDSTSSSSDSTSSSGKSETTSSAATSKAE
ncbi:MAG TPA: zinc ribbon domain-containing protein [Phycisphaerales bacterium]|nr:zinc ribbon domain-containing protein [Phycisphaerales bacterium]